MRKSHESLRAVAQALTFRHLTPAQWHMWRKVMRRQPQWYILHQSGKRHERWHAVAGPFFDPQEACAALYRLTDGQIHPVRRASERWQVASLTETMRVYHGNVPLLVDDLASAERHAAPEDSQSHPDHLALA